MLRKDFRGRRGATGLVVFTGGLMDEVVVHEGYAEHLLVPYDGTGGAVALQVVQHLVQVIEVVVGTTGIGAADVLPREGGRGKLVPQAFKVGFYRHGPGRRNRGTFAESIDLVAKIDESLRQRILQFINEALAEDVGPGDFTSEATIPPDKRDTARLLVKDVGILAGVEVARMVFESVDPTATFDQRMQDGDAMHIGDVAFYVTCNSRALLQAERLVLNTMQRMSGIATLANRYAFEVEDLPVKVLDTRKTTPNLRFLEKWAVRLGGAENYRDGLYDRIMIKDNHVDAAGSITKAIEGVQAFFRENQLQLPITVEVRNLIELMEVLEVGQVDRVMLDNFEAPLLREAVAHVNGRFETEASGGITLDSIREVAETGVDYISVGALTHSAVGLDLSLKVVK